MSTRAAVAVTLAAALLAGCVTEMGGPKPAPREARLDAQINLARGYLESDDPSRAREPLERALEIEPGSADALGLFAVYYQREEEPELAEQYYRRALRADGRHARNLNNYAALLYGQGRYREALEPLGKLVEDTSYRGRPQAYESLGLTQLQVGNREAARAAFTRALALNDDLPVSNLELADLSYQAGDYQAAQRLYDAFRARARQSSRSLCLGIRLATAVGDGDQRASYAIALRNLYPDSPEAAECLNGR